ncbi:MAG: GntG family PLP-dependent aldolase [Lachnospiraceae bacterium]|nr:GntG family PLP-dependent aldolase [Lachnospiraceae bacterium]
MRYIDFRSDTVTQPTPAMRNAMYNAVVGDDVACDDPTVIQFEELGAKILGKEKALFVASGTMGNLTAIMSHTQRGDEIIAGINSHIFLEEVAGASVVAGVSIRTLSFVNDIPDSKTIEQAIRSGDIHEPETSLICLENALRNGRIVTKESMREIYEMAHAHGLKVHVDGARIWNAAVAQNIDVKELTQYCDSITCCISKGLSAPVGAILCGNKDFIARARKNRKMLGGGMRECGILAAAGICALNEMRDRLHIDHENAKYLAEKLNAFDCIDVDLSSVQINIVFFQLHRSKEECDALPEKLYKRGIKICNQITNHDGRFRFLTNNDVSREDIDYLLQQLTEILYE